MVANTDLSTIGSRVTGFQVSGSVCGEIVTGTCLVDEEDYWDLIEFPWKLSTGYAIARVPLHKGKWKNVGIHRLLMNPRQDQVVDHINGDKLDNRKVNLRVCTHKENARNRKASKRNTNGFKGITPHHGKWRASIIADGVQYRLGNFSSKIEAALAYNAAALIHHGEFARLNVIDGVSA